MGRSCFTLVLALLCVGTPHTPGVAGCASAPAHRAGGPGEPPLAGAPPPGGALAPCGGPGAAPCAPEGPTPAEASAEGEPDEHEEVDDGVEVAQEAGGTSASSLVTLSDAELTGKLRHDPGSLGSMSVGTPNAGALFNGVAMPQGEHWSVVDPGNAWGTRETVDVLIRCIEAVNARFPDSARMYIGHISRKTGGHLSPHVSHQAGRDVDLSYFLDGKHAWYAKATDANLDRARTWAFLRALIIESDVELILVDSSVQKLLRDYAVSIGEDRAWLDRIFQVGSKNPAPLIRHAKGHATHLHVRFYNPVAQEMGRRAHAYLVKDLVVRSTPGFTEHVARKGETLGSLARRYGCSVQAIQQANGLRNTAIRAKTVYRIPAKGGGGPASRPVATGPVVIPPRRLPPASAAPTTAAGPQP